MAIDAESAALTAAAITAPVMAVASPGMAVASPGMRARAASQTWQVNLARLQGLADVLAHHGLRARVMTPPGCVPSLHVVNPAAAALAEDV